MGMLERFSIANLSQSDERPAPPDMPPTGWTHLCTLGDKYEGAFNVKAQEDADMYLLTLAGHSLRYGQVRNKEGFIVGMTWRQAFDYERTQLAWFAFARDIGSGELYRRTQDAHGNWGKVENTAARDFVSRFYGAYLPKNVTGKPAEADILERVQLKREKAAKGRKEVYWRKVVKADPPAAPAQGGLF